MLNFRGSFTLLRHFLAVSRFPLKKKSKKNGRKDLQVTLSMKIAMIKLKMPTVTSGKEIEKGPTFHWILVV